MIYVDGEFIDRPEASPADLERAIAAADRAFADYRRWPGHRRAALLEAISTGIAARRQPLADRIVAEARKPLQYARGEVDRAVQTFSFAADEARRLAGEVVAIDAAPGGEGRLGVVVRVPRGPVAAITPFNFPLNLVAHKLAPALACGATVVLKPSPDTPQTAVDLARIIHDAGAPPGVVNVVPCDTRDAGPLIEDPRLRVLSFTGSAPVGWALRARAGEKQVVLELGGNAAVIVMPDADLGAAIPRLVTAAFAYAGQICIKAQRIYAVGAIWDDLLARLIPAIEKQAIVGDPAREDVMVGPLIRVKDADRVDAWIREAVERGAKVLLGGRREGQTIWPTVLTDVPRDAKVSCEEVFGPVLVVDRARDLADAVTRVNDSPYGLQAGIYTNDHAALMQAFDSLDVGSVIHNDVPIFRVDQMPYGGSKRSGIGREGPRYAIEEMTEPRLLVMRR
jgi:acyl-CoA reductase-like NAD-dependent aldehyde dehydrogenase